MTQPGEPGKGLGIDGELRERSVCAGVGFGRKTKNSLSQSILIFASAGATGEFLR